MKMKRLMIAACVIAVLTVCALAFVSSEAASDGFALALTPAPTPTPAPTATADWSGWTFGTQSTPTPMATVDLSGWTFDADSTPAPTRTPGLLEWVDWEAGRFDGTKPAPTPDAVPQFDFSEAEEDPGLAKVVEQLGIHIDYDYPYLPTHLDPVCAFGWIATESGYNGDDFYVIYRQHYATHVQEYLDYLASMGYRIVRQECDLEGLVEWHALCPSPAADGSGLMEKLRIFHAPLQELMVVSYPYLDAFLYSVWGETSGIGADFGVYRSPSFSHTMTIAPDCSVTVEEIRFPQSVDVYAPLEQDLYQVRSKAYWQNVILYSPLIGSGLWRLDDGKGNAFPSVRLSFDTPVDADFVRRLRILRGDVDDEYLNCAEPPILLACNSNGVLTAWTEEMQTDELWVLFRPINCHALKPQRLYICLQDPADPWIGDLRQWAYADFFQHE